MSDPFNSFVVEDDIPNESIRMHSVDLADQRLTQLVDDSWNDIGSVHDIEEV